MRLRAITVMGALTLAIPAFAQQAPNAPAPAPRRATVVVPPSETTRPAGPPAMSVSLTVRGPEAASFLTVSATNADVRDLFREMGQKSGSTVLLAPSAIGRVTIELNEEPLGKAFSAVAKAAGLSAIRIVVPEADAAKITPDAAGQLAQAMDVLPVHATATDPDTGKTVTVGESASPKPAAPGSGLAAVYFLQGTLTPEQERIAHEQVASAANAPKQTDPISSAVQVFNRMPVTERVQALRDMQRQMFQNLSPQERRQLRDAMRQRQRDRRQRG